MSFVMSDKGLYPPLIAEATTPSKSQYTGTIPSPQAMSQPQTPGGALSVRSGYSGPDLMPLNELVSTMRNSLDNLGGVFDSLGEQTARIASLGPALHSSYQIQQLRKQMVQQDRRQEERIQALKVLLRDVIKERIATHVRIHVQRMIQEKVQARVQAIVAEKLKSQVPEPLKIQTSGHRAQIEDVKRSIFDADARSQNAKLKSHMLQEPIHPLRMPNGGISTAFPKDLRSMFSVNVATAKQLCADYGLDITDGPTEREDYLNRFMNHIGTEFHVLPPPPRPPFPSLYFDN